MKGISKLETVRRLIGTLVVIAPAMLLGQTVTPNTATGVTMTTRVVNNGVGNQSDPHIFNTQVSYTDDSSGVERVRYHDLSSGTDALIPAPVTAFDSLSDISGSRIVLTRIDGATSSIQLFDTSNTAAGTTELNPQPNSSRQESVIGGNTVAWQDFGPSSAPWSSAEIVVYDLVSGTPQRLTNDTAFDTAPAVSPDGLVVSWTSCNGALCVIEDAINSGGIWTTHQLTTSGDAGSVSGTNGTIVVYSRVLNGDRDIFWQAVAGGPETQLSIAGTDANPRIWGNLISFEHTAPGATQSDIYVYDLSGNTLYQVANTPQSEFLSDIWTDGSIVRVTYTQQSGTATGNDVYETEFTLPSNCTAPGSDADLLAACKNPSNRPLLASISLVGNSFPQVRSSIFGVGTGSDDGVVCIANQGTASGWVFLDNLVVASPDSFKHNATLIARRADLLSENILAGWTSGQPGTSYTVNVYGPPNGCPARNDPVIDLSSINPASIIKQVFVRGVRIVTISDGTRLIDSGK